MTADPHMEAIAAGCYPLDEDVPRRTPYDGKPYYCRMCGAGQNEFMACEEVCCQLETDAEAQARAEDHQRLMDHASVQPVT